MNSGQKQLREGLIIGDHYQIEGLLGLGDAGDVYTCRDLDGGKARLVIRTLGAAAPAIGDMAASSRVFSLLQRLRHPNLVRILDFGIVESIGTLFLVEEWIEGKDLYSATDGMDIAKVLSLVVELSKALQYLHARGIIHGNLMPSNTILSGVEEGRERLKLLDFGLTQWHPEVDELNRYGRLAYTAPEVLLGGRASKGSDMYSLGILIYQLLARRLPYEDEDPGFLIQKHLQGRVDMRPIDRLRNGDGASELVRRLLDKDPANRPFSAEEVIGLISSSADQDCSRRELDTHFSALQCVGRQKEMSALQECARHVRESGRGWTVFITGEAGSGKTRCMEELRSWALLEGWRVIEGACGVREEGAYEPYRQILARTELANGQAIFRFGKQPRAAESGTFDSSSEFAAGQFRDLLTRELVRRLMERPTMLFLHDFHRADEATNTVLDYLSSDIQAHPVLMCVSLRSGEETKGTLERVMDLAIRQERGEILALEPLTQEDVRQLVGEMTGNIELEESLGSWIFRSVGGNPFFLEEMLKHMAEQGVLHRELGEWKFAVEDLKKLEVPASVVTVLQRRIAQLSPSARELATWMALFHRATSKKLLSAVMSCTNSDIAEALQELSHRQMIQMNLKEVEETVDFSHDLIAEVIRGDLPKNIRQKMHRKIAAALEHEYGVNGHLQELAMHYIEGKSKAASVRCVLASASQSRAEFAHENALRCFEHVFKNRTSLTKEELCMAAIEASDTMLALGLPRRAVRLLNAEMLKNKAIGTDLKARMFMQLALAYQHLGDLHMQEVCCKKGLRAFRNRPDNEPNVTKATLWAELIYGAVLQSRPRQGLIFLDKSLQSCPDQSNGALAGRIQGLSAFLHRVACNLHQALAASKKTAMISCRSGESYLMCSAYSTLGGVLTALGRFPLALEKHRLAVASIDESRSAILRSQALGNLAECLCRMGRTQEAMSVAERAVKSVCESNNPAISYAFNTILAEVRLSAGDYRGASQIINKLGQEDSPNLALLTVGHEQYVAASLNFALGNFAAALRNIDQLCNRETSEAPFYEHELAEALRARILFESGSVQKGLNLLHLLDKTVAKKRWPYHMCVIKLHICEVFIRQQRLGVAEKYAKNALRLAKAMQSIPLISHGYLLLGMIYSPVRRLDVPPGSPNWADSTMGAKSFLEKSIEELQRSCEMSESASHGDLAWRAHFELCLIFRLLANADSCIAHAKKAYELLCKLEDQMPSEMLPAFYNAFNRSHAKLELIRIMEACREGNKDIPIGQTYGDENARILLRLSTTISSIREINALLEAILDQLIPALDVERALVFLIDESTGRLELARGKNNRRESLGEMEAAIRDISETVWIEGKPIITADAHRDPRMNKRPTTSNFGKLLCAPLKASDRTIGVLCADHSSPSGSFNESVINLFAAFCNLVAVGLNNALTHQYQGGEKMEPGQYLPQTREAYSEMVGKSASMEALRDRIGLAAASPLDILITGESGTGKELVARAIYRTGRRKSEKFVSVDCGSLSDSLAEAELFGYRKGAFTGAAENRQGLLEAAHGGIIFLDEVANMPFRLQAKLLRVLQEREVRRIGETTPRKIDIHVIAATNKDLLEEMRAGRFRRDLFYRLRAMEIRVPPLREHSEDIPLLIEWFLKKTSELESGRFKRFKPEALDLLRKYSYPGNIRELKNIVAGSYYSTVGVSIGPDELPPEVRRDDVEDINSESYAAGRLYNEILEGKGGFENLVKEPFLKHQFGSSLVRGVIQRALKDAGGRYRDAFVRLRIPDERYSMTIQFLKRYKCYLDFRPYRRIRINPNSQR